MANNNSRAREKWIERDPEKDKDDTSIREFGKDGGKFEKFKFLSRKIRKI